VKTLFGQLSKALEGPFADIELRNEMLKEVRSQAKGPPAAALKDRRRLTKARVIDQDEVIALREAREARDAKKSKNTT